MRVAIACVALVVSLSTTGCSLPASGYLHDYAGVGGKWQRTDPVQGRVGSLLSDAGEVLADGGQLVDHYSETPQVESSGDGYYNMDPTIDESSTILESTESTSLDDGVIILSDSF